MPLKTPTEAELLERRMSVQLFMRALKLLITASEFIDDHEYQRQYRMFLYSLDNFLKGKE